MTERKSTLHSALSLPSVSALYQRLIGAHSARKKISQLYFSELNTEDKVLDLGCGAGVALPYISNAQYVGVDKNIKAINQARSIAPNTATFINSDALLFMQETSDRYSLIIAGGLLHHLSDDNILHFLRLVKKCLAPNGRLLTIDPTFINSQNWLSRLLMKLDKGINIKHPSGYRALADSVFPHVHVAVKTDLLYVPYSHCIIESKAEAQEIKP